MDPVSPSAALRAVVRAGEGGDAVPQTLAQKLIAAACGRETVAEGEIVTCRVDLAMFHDSSGPRRLEPMLREVGARLWDPARVVLVIDHYVPESDEESRRIVRIARNGPCASDCPISTTARASATWCCRRAGICGPACSASAAIRIHSPASLRRLHVRHRQHRDAGRGRHRRYLRVPRTLMMRWNGRLGAGVTAKDMMLRMIGRLGMNGGRYQAVEFCGEAVRALSMQERMTLSNMSAELGSQVGLVAPDATTEAWLREAGVRGPLDIAHWQSDPDADAEWHDFDAAALAPQVAALAQPRQCGGCERPCWRGGAGGLYRRLHRRCWTTCAPQPPCCAAAAWRRASS